MSDFPDIDFEIDDKDEYLKEMLMSLGVDDEIIEIACYYEKLDILTKKLKLKRANELVMKNLRIEMLERSLDNWKMELRFSVMIIIFLLV